MSAVGAVPTPTSSGRNTRQSKKKKVRDPNNPEDAAYLRAMHPDFDDLMKAADVDYRTVSLQDAKFADHFRIPPVIDPARGFHEHTNSVDAVCFGPDPGTIISGSHDALIKVWDASSGRCVSTMQGHVGGIYHCAVSTAQRILVSCGGGGDRNVLLWRLQQPNAPQELRGHSRAVHHVSLSADGKAAATADQDGTVVIHDLDRMATVLSSNVHLGVTHGSAFCAQDANLLCTAGQDGILRLTDIREATTPANWRLSSSVANCVSVEVGLSVGHAHDGRPVLAVEFPDAKTLLTGGADHKMKRWDLRMAPWKPRPAGEYLGHSAPVRCLALSPDQRYAISGCDDGSCRLWRTDEMKGLRTSQAQVRTELKSAETNAENMELPDDKRRAARLNVTRLKQAQVDLKADERKLKQHGYSEAIRTLNGHVSRVSSCAFRQDGQDRATVISSSWDQSVQLFNLGPEDFT